MTQYLKIDSTTTEVLGGCGLPDAPDFVGEPEPAPEPEDGVTFRPWQTERLKYSARPSPDHILIWPQESVDPEWFDAGGIETKRLRAIAGIDAFADSARLAVVGDAARIKEYERAQAGAEAYRDAGYTGPVPPGVASWAYAKRRSEWTAQQAAEDILAASARWYAALDGIRALRLDAKEAARFAETNEEVVAIAATFRATLTAAMQGVQ